jgi:hypothetical protein
MQEKKPWQAGHETSYMIKILRLTIDFYAIVYKGKGKVVPVLN